MYSVKRGASISATAAISNFRVTEGHKINPSLRYYSLVTEATINSLKDRPTAVIISYPVRGFSQQSWAQRNLIYLTAELFLNYSASLTWQSTVWDKHSHSQGSNPLLSTIKIIVSLNTCIKNENLSLIFGFRVFPLCSRWIFQRHFGSRYGSRNIVRKFTSRTLQKPWNQKLIFIPRWKFKIKNLICWLIFRFQENELLRKRNSKKRRERVCVCVCACVRVIQE